jgi:uncharacterized protein YndB with AHSA1/START domain
MVTSILTAIGDDYRWGMATNTPSQLVAKTSISIHSPANKVWDALITPELVSRYMFGARVESTWKAGAPIVWKGEWKGKPYEDKGIVVEATPEHLLQYTHFSPLSGQPDVPENYHTVTIALSDSGDSTLVELSQDHNPTEAARAESEHNWQVMLQGLKKTAEG